VGLIVLLEGASVLGVSDPFLSPLTRQRHGLTHALYRPMNDVNDRLLGGVALITVLACLVGVLVAAYPAVTFNPTKFPPSQEQMRSVQMLLPEGFAFFTRNPRERDLYVYQRTDSTWASAMLGPKSQASNLFGFSRRSRMQSVETALLLSKTTQEDWTDCERTAETCLSELPVQDTVTNVQPRPTVCGVAGFARRKPVPWAWSDKSDRLTMPSTITKLKISC
jgi:antimicrobial peptide system protein, SdpA family